MIDWNLIGVFATIILTILGATYGQFISLRNLIYRMKEDILDKLEYHERHDDRRFEGFGKDLWEMRVAWASSEARKNKESN